MAVHEALGKSINVEGKMVRIGHLRREMGLGVASMGGYLPAYLVRLSDLSVVCRLDNNKDFDEVIKNGSAS